MFNIANHTFSSRLLTGSGKFAGADIMQQAVKASGAEIVTLALKRIQRHQPKDATLQHLRSLPVTLLPNTSGAKTADEAIYAAHLARELLGTQWLKLEIHPDQHHLLPDPIETLKAAETLVKEGFTVLPYCHADPMLCYRLQEVGCAAVMPLGAPIGSNQGLKTKDFLQIIVEQTHVPVIVDAGIGLPSQACAAMEMGCDAVLVNTAIATAHDPVAMAGAFAEAVSCGRRTYKAGAANVYSSANASSPLTAFLGDESCM